MTGNFLQKKEISHNYFVRKNSMKIIFEFMNNKSESWHHKKKSSKPGT